MLTKHPAQLDLSELEQKAVEELCDSQLCSEELSGEELAENNNLTELEGIALHTEQIELDRSALHTEKIELEHTASKMNQDSLPERSLRENELHKEPSASQPDEGKRAYAASGQESLASQLWGKELENIFAFPLLHSEQGALEQSASENSSSANSGNLPSLIRVSVILTVISLHLFSLSFVSSFSSLTCQSLSFQMSSYSLNCTSLSFQPLCPNGWAHELAELDDIALQNELPTTFGNSELENKAKLGRTCWEEESDKTFELQNLLGDQELAKFLAHKTCPLDLLHDHLGQEHLCANQLRQNPLENEKNKKLDENKELDKKNFQSLILEKLVALLPKKHFALAASTQLLGNEAREKSREASQISFDKVGDKEFLQEELRRQELGYKDLWPAYFRALCPTSFEENSFTKRPLPTPAWAKRPSQRTAWQKTAWQKTAWQRTAS